MPRTTVVIPCYNEANRLALAELREFVTRHDDIDLLMVNDGSTDATLKVLARLQDGLGSRIQILDLPINMGKAEAVRQGMLQAFTRQPSYACFWDADLATPLETIIPFRDTLQRRPELELVIGSRVSLLGRHVQRKWHRHALGRLFATAASWALRLPVYDTQCGAKMFRVGPLSESLFEDPFCSRWIFDVEILARLITNWPHGDRAATSAIYEFPLDAWRDVEGSKLTHRDFLRAAVALGTIAYRYAPRRRHPKILRPIYPRPINLDHQQTPAYSDKKRRAA